MGETPAVVFPKDLHLQGNGGFLVTTTPPGTIFTREQLNGEQLEIGKTAKTFMETKVFPKIEEIEKKACDSEGKPVILKLFKEAGDLGLFGVDIPEEYGGLEMDWGTTVHLIENWSVYGSMNVTCIAHMGIGTLPILFFGTKEQKDKYLPKLVSGEWVSCYALTEQNSGSDALSGKTKAVLEGDHYILNGSKQFITNGSWADVAIVFTGIDGQYSALIVELNQPGVVRGAEEKKMGLAGSSTIALTFENVKVPKENLLGKIGDASSIALNILNMGRFELGAATVGSMKFIIERTMNYIKEREQFGRPIAWFEMQQAKLGLMVAMTFAHDSLIYRLVDCIDKKIEKIEGEKGPEYYAQLVKVVRSYAMEASISKVIGSEALHHIACEGVKMHGGYGYVSEYPAERALRDCFINMIFEGTNDINRLVIFDSLVRNIYSVGIPFTAFVEEAQKCLRTRKFAYPADDKILLPEKSSLYAAKYLFACILQEAILRYGKDMRNNQEVMKNISDMAIAIYTLDSALARAHYLLEKKPANAEIIEDMARLSTAENIKAIQEAAWQAFREIFDGRERPALEENLKWLCGLMEGKYNTIALRRKIGQTVLEKGMKFAAM